MEKKCMVLSLIKMTEVIEKAKKNRMLTYSKIQEKVTPYQKELLMSEITINENINLSLIHI